MHAQHPGQLLLLLRKVQVGLFQSLQHDGISRTLIVLRNVARAERVQLGGPGGPAQNLVELQPQ